ncbi:MAG: Neelaredoxin [Candidatus Eisenbacteria bacterium]|nr:Neelaredoxin [Candidatus Eisenbacteria bacterium]
MSEFGERFQSADWKSEKHVPVIDAPEEVKAGEIFDVRITLGKEVAHPNETAHHIRWVDVHFHPDGTKFPIQVARAEFAAHGAAPDGPDSSGVYAHHEAVVQMKAEQSGTLLAASYCNIHGLWENTKKITVNK